ncbi:extracellular solute-binding protein [Gracilibacillus alcaliphilus]|uniref:extracellular solute-binding protein n=1 Tax=Gracilibacillus alcaliphilus TaxID=1401441 RepID=UPI00195921CA|nr:extracellular solute-binding protein [Gracilibacillus alcaliphilus]MBM7677576.1 ABC-type glycerol-3-phosphate transport system substrate-binding protein [Gracilibacillus alcaliphilus]
MKQKLLVFLMIVISFTLLAACSNEGSSGEGDGEVTLKVLHNWNGSGGGAPEDPVNNPVAEKIREETGVTLDIEYTNGSEVDKLTQVLATGEFPDVYIGPAWGKEAELLLEAANDGLLHDLTPYIEEHERLAEVLKEENMSVSLYNDIISQQQGGQFILHSMFPATEDDIVDWLYGLYVNKDIADEVGIDPNSVQTPDDLYNFLKAVKEGGFETNGNEVFPLGAYDNGWPLDITSEMFVPVAGAGSWFIDEEGNARYNFMTEEYEEWVLFMRKLMHEGLLDPEVFSHTGTIAREKISQGRYAVMPNQFNGMWNDTKQGGLEENYVPLGPMEDFNGDRYRTEFNVQGSQLIAIFADASEEKLEAFVKLFDYLSSDEGYMLAKFGVEGEHYDLEDGEVVAKEEAVEKINDGTLKDEGIDTAFLTLTGLDRESSLGGGPFGHQVNKQYQAKQEFMEIFRQDGVNAATGLDPYAVLKNHPNFAQIEPVTTVMGDVVQQAIHSSTDEEALSIINETREALRNAGIEEVAAEITEQAKSGTEFMRYRTSN